MERTPAAIRWSRLSAEYEASGMSLRRFAAMRGVNPNTLAWWRSKLRRDAAAERSSPREGTSVRFAEVVVEAPEPQAVPAGGPAMPERLGERGGSGGNLQEAKVEEGGSQLRVYLRFRGRAVEFRLESETDLGLFRRALEALC